MKKLILGSFLAMSGFASLNAQDLADINKYMLLQKYADAKPLVEKAEANDKLNKKPELYAIKTNLYTGLAKAPGTTPENAAADFTIAAAAWEKYKSLEPTAATLKANSNYVNGPVGLYSYYREEGNAKFNSKNWAGALTNFKSAVEVTDVLIANKLIAMTFDTITNLYAGYSAQNLKKDDDAVMIYTKLADRKISGDDYEVVYQYLANSYMDKKDEANFKKYVELGKTLYPKSKYFPQIEGEYIRQSGDFNKVVAYNETKVAENPNDYSLVFDLGADIYNYLNPKDTSKAPKGDVTELETKMVNAFTKAAQLKPEAGMPNSILGNYYYNKAVLVSSVEIKSVNAAMKNANAGIKPDKTGKLPPIPKELITKREDLYKKYDAYEDTALSYYEKAAVAFGKAEKIEPFEKQHYKNAVNYLIELNDDKKGSNAKKPAEAAKYAAASKKWADVYDKIK